MVKELGHMTGQVGRRVWESWSCSEKAKGDLITVFSYLMGRYRENKARHVSVVHNDRARDTKHELEHRKFAFFDLL